MRGPCDVEGRLNVSSFYLNSKLTKTCLTLAVSNLYGSQMQTVIFLDNFSMLFFYVHQGHPLLE